MTRGFKTFQAFAVVCGLSCSLALATPFPNVGGSYTGNVVYRLSPTGTNLATIDSTFQSGGITLASNPDAVVNYSDDSWQIGHWGAGPGDFSSLNAYAGVVIKMDQVYTLNKLHLDTYPYSAQPSSYEVSLSPDNSTWTTVQPKTAWTGNAANPTFAATDAQYIKWTVWGTGLTDNESTKTSLSNVQAYVASTALSVPQKEQSYNLAVAGSIFSESGWQGWGPAVNAIDGNLWSDGANPASNPATAVYNLGNKYTLDRLRTSMYGSLTGGTIEVSADNSFYTTVFAGTLTGATMYTLSSPTLVQYIRVTVTGGGGHLRELQAFAFIPEPASLSLLALGGLALLRRRK